MSDMYFRFSGDPNYGMSEVVHQIYGRLQKGADRGDFVHYPRTKAVRAHEGRKFALSYYPYVCED